MAVPWEAQKFVLALEWLVQPINGVVSFLRRDPFTQGLWSTLSSGVGGHSRAGVLLDAANRR